MDTRIGVSTMPGILGTRLASTMHAMTDLLKVDVATQGERTVISATGEIDLSTAPMLETLLDEMSGVDGMVLDLSGVTFIDSTGLRVILGADTKAGESGRGLAIVATDGPVMRLFELTGVDVRLSLFESVAAATTDA